MAGKCFVDVKKDVIDEIGKRALTTNAFSSVKGESMALQVENPEKARLSATQINSDFKDEVIKPSYSDPDNFYIIDPSDKLINRYLNSHPNKNESLLQTPSFELEKVSSKVMTSVNEFLNRIGVDVKQLTSIKDERGVTISANGRALLLKSLIEVVKGKEANALPEEAMHFAVEIIEQKDKALFNSMLSKIGEYKMYKDIINDNSPSSYKTLYTTPDGKPDIRKIKKEVMGKLLANAVIKQVDGEANPSLMDRVKLWWDNIVNSLKSIFNKSNIDPFELAARRVLSKKVIGKASDIKDAEIFYSQNENIIKANMKLVGALNTPKARMMFERLFKKGDKDTFFNKLTYDLQAPKNQVGLLKQWIESHNPSSVDDMITGIASEMSYVIEINTAKHGNIGDKQTNQFVLNGWAYRQGFSTGVNAQNRIFDRVKIANENANPWEPEYLSDKEETITQDEFEKARLETGENTSHYSSLTVPGGTNYTENELSTPAIVPSIKGHAQFATDNGIGWFRSDEQVLNGDVTSGRYENTFSPDDNQFEPGETFVKTEGGTPTKTRRILEVQSDLFQKGRDKKDLIGDSSYYEEGIGEMTNLNENPPNEKQNQFLQLLNKDNNWVTFFIKSIIQDSAKKGYENVLFPTGNTASKIEGHTTLEEFKKQKEDRIKELEKPIEFEVKREIGTSQYRVYNKGTNKSNSQGLTEEQANTTLELLREQSKDWHTKEINQLKQELERVEKEGFGALKPIFKFYEENVTNILKKIGNTEKITDEYGNTWTKYTLSGKDKGEFYYQLDNKNPQDEINRKLDITKNEVTKKYKEDVAKTGALEDESDVNNWYEIAGKIVGKRVTDLVKTWYSRKFKDKEFTAFEKKFNEMKRDTGVKGHSDMEELMNNKFIDPVTHLPRAIPIPLEDGERGVMGDATTYRMMYNFLNGLIAQHSADTKFYSEVVVYDKKEDRAGTIDLLAIDKNGKAHIYDWKFMSIAKGRWDIPFYKQTAYEIQIRAYRNILKNNYGVKEFGDSRAIPIIMEYEFLNSTPILTSVKMGDSDTNQITELKYIPVPVDEKTSSLALDRKIEQLEKQYKREAAKSVKEHRKDIKALRLNTISEAIRLLRAQENLFVFKNVMAINVQEMKRLLDKYNTQYKNIDINKLSEAEKSEFAGDVLEQLSIADLYKDIDSVFDRDIQDRVEKQTLTEEDSNEIRETLTKSAREVRIGYQNLKDVADDFADRFIGQKNSVTGLLSPQRVVKGLISKFTSMSKLGLKSLDLLFKIVSTAQDKARHEAITTSEAIIKNRAKVIEWAEKKGIKKDDVFKFMYKKDKEGKRVHVLIDEIDRKFYDTLRDMSKEGDLKWISDNIDLEDYQKKSKKYIKQKEEELNATIYPGDEAEQKQRLINDLETLYKTYDMDSHEFTGWGNKIMKTSIKDKAKWYSKEFKAIKGTPLEELFNIHQQLNSLAVDIGYLERGYSRTFTPFLKKTLADKILWGGNVSVVQSFIDDLATPEDIAQYQETDDEGNPVPSLPKYYTRDIGKRTADVKGNETVDYSNVSEDMFKNLIAYNVQLNKYKYLSEVEDQIALLQTIEEFKGHLETTSQGGVRKDEKGLIVIGAGKEGGNTENAKLLDDYVRMVVYGQKYVQSTADSKVDPLLAATLINPAIGLINGVKGLVNMVAGKEVWTKTEMPDSASMIKSIDALNRARRLQILSLNISSSLAVLFGNNIQVAAQSGEYFSTRNFLKNEMKIVRQTFTNRDREIIPAFMNTFLPMNEDMSTHLFKHAGLKKIGNKNLGDWLMITMSKPDELLEKAVFMSLMDNMMIGDDGRFVNINKYAKDLFPARNSSGAERSRSQPLIEKEIKKLQDTRAISKIASVDKDGKLSIPGFDMNNRDEIIRLAQLSKIITQNANANVTEFNKTQMQMGVFTNSMMLFKNWIPGLVSTRFGNLTKQSDSFEGSRYDIGRIRLMFNMLGEAIKTRSNVIFRLLKMNDKGLDEVNKLYEKYKEDYFNRTGEEFDMKRDDFIDLIQNNIRNGLKEMAMLAGLVAAMLALGAVKPEDDKDKRTKNMFKIAYRLFDKMQNELSFFYDPRSAIQLSNGNLFPSTGLIADYWKLANSLLVQGIGSEQDNKTNHPLKYISKVVPVSSSWLLYVGAIDPDIQKALQINIPMNADAVR